MSRRLSENDWQQMRRDYQDGHGSLRNLAARYGASFSTVAKRSSRENWNRQRTQLGNIVEAAVTTSALKSAAERGESLALDASETIRRTLTTATNILNKIDAELAKPQVDIDALRTLTCTWRDCIGVLRSTHGLDVPAHSIGQLNQQFIRMDIMDASAELMGKILSARETAHHLAPVLSVITAPVETK